MRAATAATAALAEPSGPRTAATAAPPPPRGTAVPADAAEAQLFVSVPEVSLTLRFVPHLTPHAEQEEQGLAKIQVHRLHALLSRRHGFSISQLRFHALHVDDLTGPARRHGCQCLLSTSLTPVRPPSPCSGLPPLLPPLPSAAAAVRARLSLEGLKVRLTIRVDAASCAPAATAPPPPDDVPRLDETEASWLQAGAG